MNSLIIHTTRKNKQSGFTLLEVLITLVILAIGLLGLAGLQAVGLSQNHSAYHRTQATQLAYSITDRIRANQVASANYLTAFMVASSATQKAACNTGAGCSAANMAENDLFEWNDILTATLPSGVGTITIAGSVFTVTINWDDNRDGAVIDCPAANCDPTFQLSFQP